MTRIVVRSKVGADGTLHVTVPVGVAEANREVQVTIEPATTPPPPRALTREEWWQFIQSTAGTWQGDFERPAQGEYDS